MNRRQLLGIAAGAVAGTITVPLVTACSTSLRASSDATPQDEEFWKEVRGFYRPPEDLLDFDQAASAATPIPVVEACAQHARKLSRGPSHRFGAMWLDEVEASRKALAAYLGTQTEVMAFVGSATVGLNTVLHGFPMNAGDEILVTDHEYPDMIETILTRERRDGIVMRRVAVPDDAASDRLLERIEAAITPRVRLLLISHVSAWNGQVLPVREVSRLARSRGVAVLVDAAQSVGMLEVDYDAIGCDFLASSMHKWLGSAIASGVLLMRKEHQGKVWPLHPPSWDTAKYPMDLYEWSGTFDIAARATIAQALLFEQRIGRELKLARTRYLAEYWMSRVARIPGTRILTPHHDPQAYCVGSFMIEGIPSSDLAAHLRKNNGIVVQNKAGRHSPFENAIRVSPPVYATPAELDRFIAAVARAAEHGVPATTPA